MALVGKRGVFLIIDAIVFSLLIFAILFMLPSQSNTQHSQNAHITFAAKDFIRIISELSVGEYNSSFVQEKIADGNITNLNSSILDQIGEFWATGKDALAYNLSKEVLESIVPDHLGYGVWIDEDLIYSTSGAPRNTIISSREIVSGLEKNKPIYGFVSRAQATSISGSGTLVFGIPPEGAGSNYGNVVITKYMNLTNLTITSADLILASHADPYDDRIWVDFNNGLCNLVRSDLTWEYGTSEGNIGVADISGCLIDGMNKFQIYLVNRGYNSHTHPGTKILVNYDSNISLGDNSIYVSKKYFLDDVISTNTRSSDSYRVGAWSSFTFDIPSEVSNLSVRAQIAGRNVRDYTGTSWFSSWSGWRRRRDYDYSIFLNDDNPFDSDASPASNPVYNYDMNDLGTLLVNGTNILSVYFNNYGDTFWGSNWVQIYSDQVSDPTGSSFIEVNYTLKEAIPYGLIEINELHNFTGGDSSDRIESFRYPDEAIEKSDTYVHLAQRTSYEMQAWADTFNPPTTQIFESPSARSIPTSTYVDPSLFSISSSIDNYIRLRDSGNNQFVTDYSFIESRFYVPSFVGYGDVFATENESIDDAKSRLNDTMGALIDVNGLTVESSSITDVPSLWGPSVVEVRVWD